MDVLLDSSSQSESEEERGGGPGDGSLAGGPGPSSGFSARTSFSRTSSRNLTRRDNLTDYFDHESYLQVRKYTYTVPVLVRDVKSCFGCGSGFRGVLDPDPGL